MLSRELPSTSDEADHPRPRGDPQGPLSVLRSLSFLPPAFSLIGRPTCSCPQPTSEALPPTLSHWGNLTSSAVCPPLPRPKGALKSALSPAISSSYFPLHPHSALLAFTGLMLFCVIMICRCLILLIALQSS